MDRWDGRREFVGFRAQIALATAVISVELAVAVFFLREIATAIAR